MGHVYKGIVFSHKKEWNNATCSNIDGPRHYHTKWSKTEKDKHRMVLCICWFLKIKRDTNKLTYKTKNRLREKDLIVDGGEIDCELQVEK